MKDYIKPVLEYNVLEVELLVDFVGGSKSNTFTDDDEWV
jgi:hypothetical protein